MLSALPLNIKDVLARAKMYASKALLERSLETLSGAFVMLKEVHLVGQGKITLQSLLSEIVSILNTNKDLENFCIDKALPFPFFKYERGHEEQLVKSVLIINEVYPLYIKQIRDQEEEEDSMKREKDLDTIRDFLSKKEMESVVHAIRKYFINWGRENIKEYLQIITILEDEKCYALAASVSMNALRQHPSEKNLYLRAAKYYELAKEYGQAETLYMSFVNAFGANASVLLCLVKLYKRLGKVEKLCAVAKKLITIAPNMEEAQKIWKEAEEYMQQSKE
ncbi:MAG: tetratricopeptide repeat protein [Desulfovibrionaceae bacterium]